MGSLWQTTRKFVYKRILHADDTPHRIALGVGLATFVAFTPTMGLQTVIAVGLAALLRANKAVCIPMVWITNPLTFAPIYWSCWRLGSWITPAPEIVDETTALNKLATFTGGAEHSVVSYEFWAHAFRVMVDLGTELWIGCTIVGLVAGVILYFVTRSIVITYRTRREQRRMHAHELRRKRLASRRKIGLPLRESA